MPNPRGRIRWANQRELLSDSLVRTIGTERATLTRSEYEALRHSQEDAPLPSYQTILTLAPNATSFAEALGVLTDGKISLNPTQKPRANDPNFARWTEEEIIQFLRDWFAVEKDPTIRRQPSAFNRWREANNEDRIPSSSTIYARFGGWDSAIDMAERDE